MNLLEAIRVQLAFMMIVIFYEIFMKWFNPERKSLFDRDNSDLLIFYAIFFVSGVFVRYYFDLPLLGWFGYLM